MATESGVVIVGRSEELDLALDAVIDVNVAVYAIPTVAEAEEALLGPTPPPAGAVLICLDDAPQRCLDLIRSLRERSALSSTPIVVWADAGSARLLPEAYAAGASSGVLLGEAGERAIRLAQVIHYWAVANDPPVQQPLG